MALDNIPMTPSGVGFNSSPVRWSYVQYGQFLNVFGLRNHISITFNLKQAYDIDKKLQSLYDLRDKGVVSNDDISELEERLRMYNDFEMVGQAPHTLAGIREAAKRRKGQKYVTYHHGKREVHVARGSRKESSDKQKQAAANARRYAHTPEADKNRRLSISAKGDDKIIDEL